MVPGVSNAPNHVVGAASAQRSAGASNCAKLRPAGHARLALESKRVGAAVMPAHASHAMRAVAMCQHRPDVVGSRRAPRLPTFNL